MNDVRWKQRFDNFDRALPYRFDVKSYDRIRHPPLLEHIQRVGRIMYRQTDG